MVKASRKQIVFCMQLGIDVEGNTVGVANAKLLEEVQKSFWGIEQLESPTEKQIELAAKFSIDISIMSRVVGSAYLNDIMSQLNHNTIREQKLRPGLHVFKRYDSLEMEYVISSISEDGTVYFKGGNGQKAWARSLISKEME